MREAGGCIPPAFSIRVLTRTRGTGVQGASRSLVMLFSPAGYEAVPEVIGIHVVTDDVAARVYSKGPGKCGTRVVDRGEPPFVPHKAVGPVVGRIAEYANNSSG